MSAEEQRDVDAAIQAARRGDNSRLGALLQAYRHRLRRMVEIRMNPDLRARLDGSDVVQEALVEATQRIDDYEPREGCSFYLWVRFLAAQKLQQLERAHLGTAKRDARRDRHLASGLPGVSSVALANLLLDSGTSPTRAVAREEDRARLLAAIESMDDTDREILALRYFENLSSADAADVLGITPNAASVRAVRALRKLTERMRHDDGDTADSA